SWGASRWPAASSRPLARNVASTTSVAASPSGVRVAENFMTRPCHFDKSLSSIRHGALGNCRDSAGYLPGLGGPAVSASYCGSPAERLGWRVVLVLVTGGTGDVGPPPIPAPAPPRPPL